MIETKQTTKISGIGLRDSRFSPVMFDQDYSSEDENSNALPSLVDSINVEINEENDSVKRNHSY